MRRSALAPIMANCRAFLAGNVVISQGDLTVRAGRATMAFSTDGGGFKIHRLDAVGGVRIVKGGQSASGDVAIYDFDRRLITLAGNVVLLRGSDRLTGGRLTIDLTSGLSTIDGRIGGGSPALGGDSGAATPRGGRITGTFTVPKKSN
jgi:lipopolysaccharide export system protein LptA